MGASQCLPATDDICAKIEGSTENEMRAENEDEQRQQEDTRHADEDVYIICL